MTFKRVNDFSTDKPEMLDRELSQLEDNVSAQFDLMDKTLAKAPVCDTFMPLGAASIIPFLPGEQLSVDTSQGNALAVLPALGPANFGKCFVLIKRQAANSISVSCSTAGVTHNAVALPLTVTAVGVRVFYCDASGYYS